MIAGILLLFATQVFAWSHVRIVNKTDLEVYGEIKYIGGSAWECETQTYALASWGAFTAPSRGACLVHEITVSAYDLGNGTPYKSSIGTAYVQFIVVKSDDGQPMVTRP
ncbi:hypothetical protein [Endozoicomonas sp. 2B-B]